MPPTKRSRASAKRSADEDTTMQDAPSHAPDAVSSDDSDDSDDDDDELTFTAQAIDEDEDEDEDDEDEDDAMDGQAHGNATTNGGLVNVEFVFSDPREEHFHSVKQFLLAYLPSSQPFNVSGLANLIVAQVAAGTMVCAEGESDVYGFITALGLERYKDDSSLHQVLSYITKRVPSADASRFQHILATKNVALVVNERMVNMPYQLVPPLHAALHEDIEWAIANETTPALRASFEFDYFLILASCTIEKASASTKAKGKKAKTEGVATGAKFYANFEDEFLEPEAEISFSFETPKSDRERPDQGQKHSVVLLIDRARHKAALANIAAMINA